MKIINEDAQTTIVENVKLIKNSRGYNWEIRVIGTTDEDLKRLKEINLKIQKEYEGEI